MICVDGTDDVELCGYRIVRGVLRERKSSQNLPPNYYFHRELSSASVGKQRDNKRFDIIA